MRVERLSLGVVEPQILEDGVVVPHIQGLSSDGNGQDPAEGYSQFKYGDGRSAQSYGAALAHQTLQTYPELLDEPEAFVTSSAYKVAPPASQALVQPFIETATRLARAHGGGTEFTPFKINRTNLTDGDYATMGAEARMEIMKRNGLSLPEDLNLQGRPVIALDDILVTGSHEGSIQKVLKPRNPDAVYYAYILHVQQGEAFPTLESALNGRSIDGIKSLIDLAGRPGFTPNARLCKYILSQTVEDITAFCREAPADVVRRTYDYIEGDELGLLPSYALGSVALAAAVHADAYVS